MRQTYWLRSLEPEDRPLGVTYALLLAFLVNGCGTYYYSRSALPTNLQQKVEEAEAYYMEQAKKKAVFVTGCNGEVTVKSLERTTVKNPLLLERGFWTNTVYQGEVTTAIGVTACGTRLLYNVVCGTQKDYEASLGIFKGAAHCDVVQDGGAAKAEIQKVDDADAEDAARRRAQQQQRR